MFNQIFLRQRKCEFKSHQEFLHNCFQSVLSLIVIIWWIKWVVTKKKKLKIKKDERKYMLIIIINIIKKLWNMLVISIILGALGTVLKDQNSWRVNEKSRPSKLQFCQDQPEYWEKSWRPEETCCHSDSSESPPVNTGMKNLQGVK